MDDQMEKRSRFDYWPDHDDQIEDNDCSLKKK